jgi:dTDP-4-dehydrorhamnose 3,5-epimerase-like enzyme
MIVRNHKPEVITGGRFQDERGIINYANDFKLDSICRFYTINHLDTQTVRAWQGHPTENKYFFVLQGKFVVAWVEIDNFENPSDNLKAQFKILNHNIPAVLHIPPGYANGLRALEPNSLIAVFCDIEVEQSLKEKTRFTKEKWFDWFQDFG